MSEPYEVGPWECRYCGNVVKFTVTAQDFSQVCNYESEIETPLGSADFSLSRGWVHRLLLCPACKEISFERVFTEDGVPEESEFIYPELPPVPEGFPVKVAKEYVAALKERKRNPNAYGAMLGRVLDAICSDRRIPVRNNGRLIGLFKRLELLASKENLSPVAGGATGLRNSAAHADAGELRPEEVPILEALVRYVLDHLYVIPALDRRATAARQMRAVDV